MKWVNIKNSNTFRVLFIGFLILLLLIPMGMVESLIADRGHLYRQASSEITASWGKEQLIMGPVLTLPYVRTFPNKSGWSAEQKNKHLQPEDMTVNTTIETQIRYRGIYKVPVYTADVQISGKFNLLEPKNNNTKKSHLQLNDGIIRIPVQGSRALKKPIKFLWDNEEIILSPEGDVTESDRIIFTAKLPTHLLDINKSHKFQYFMTLAGSELFSFLSSSKHTSIAIKSNWESPSFYGRHLPTKREISSEGFTAS